ncbi:hypothetical protein MMC13_004233 [Lambiella insularis]|nr:hypothetical protein [Lambiella insularis]
MTINYIKKAVNDEIILRLQQEITDYRKQLHQLRDEAKTTVVAFRRLEEEIASLKEELGLMYEVCDLKAEAEEDKAAVADMRDEAVDDDTAAMANSDGGVPAPSLQSAWDSPASNMEHEVETPATSTMEDEMDSMSNRRSESPDWRPDIFTWYMEDEGDMDDNGELEGACASLHETGPVNDFVQEVGAAGAEHEDEVQHDDMG